MQANHVVVWLDHSQAHVIAFNRETAAIPVIVHSPYREEHEHHLADRAGVGRASERPGYYEQIIVKIRQIPQWLIVGPSTAKLEFSKHVSKKHADLIDHVIGIETVDHPSDGQLLAYAKKYFVAADQMAGVPTPT